MKHICYCKQQPVKVIDGQIIHLLQLAAKKRAANGDYKSDSEKGEWVFIAYPQRNWCNSII